MNDRLQGKYIYIFGEECFKITALSADGGAERITEGSKTGESEKIPGGLAGLGLLGTLCLGAAVGRWGRSSGPTVLSASVCLRVGTAVVIAASR